MTAHPLKKTMLTILPFLIFLLPAAPLAAQQSSDPGKKRIPGWAQWAEKLAQPDERLLAQLPERLRNGRSGRSLLRDALFVSESGITATKHACGAACPARTCRTYEV